MRVRCRYCRCRHQLTRAAYDDMEYLGAHSIKCKNCKRLFSVKTDGVHIRAVK